MLRFVGNQHDSGVGRAFALISGESICAVAPTARRVTIVLNRGLTRNLKVLGGGGDVNEGKHVPCSQGLGTMSNGAIPCQFRPRNTRSRRSIRGDECALFMKACIHSVGVSLAQFVDTHLPPTYHYGK